MGYGKVFFLFNNYCNRRIHDFSFLQKRKNLRRMPRQQTTNRHCRTDIAAVVPEIGYFFFGGELRNVTKWPVDKADSYDVSTNAWTVTHLSVAGFSMAAATIGNNVFLKKGMGAEFLILPLNQCCSPCKTAAKCCEYY